MVLLKQIIQQIVSFLGIVGVLLIVIVTFFVWVYYDLILKDPLNIEELSGLFIFTVVIISIGLIVYKSIKKK